MEGLLKDLRQALRMFHQRKLFAIAAVLTIALGIGATTAIFSVVYGVLLRPLPYQDPNGLMLVRVQRPEAAFKAMTSVSTQTYLDWRQNNPVFEDLAAFRLRSNTVTARRDANADKIKGSAFTVNTLSLLGVHPVIGRDFTQQEGKLGNGNVILLGYGLWQREFGGDRNVLGKQAYVDGEALTVVGVMPPGFEFPLGTEFWTPQAPEQFLLPDQNGKHMVIAALQVIGRLKPGITYDQAQGRMSQLGASGEPGARILGSSGLTKPRVVTESLLETIVGNARTILLVFGGAVMFVLLIACANVANLLMVRAAAREQEIAVRSALGAPRWRLMRQLFSESLMIGLAGAVIGAGLAYAGMRLFLAVNPGNIPRIEDVRMDLPVFLFALAAAVITGLLFGLAPAIGATRPDLIRSLREASGGAGSGHAHRGRLRGALVLIETALALVLMVGAGLLLKSFVRMANLDPGIETKGVLAATVMPAARGGPLGGGLQMSAMMSDDADRVLRDSLDRLSSMPGVQSVAFATSLPPGGMLPKTAPSIEGQLVGSTQSQQESEVLDVSDGYFRTLRVPIVQGRDFLPEDVAQKRNFAIVSQSFVSRYMPREEAVGRRFQIGGEMWTIIGVAKDVRQSDLRTPPDAIIYRPRVEQMVNIGGMRMVGPVNLMVRTAGEPGPMLAEMKTALDPMSGQLRVIRISLLDTDVWKDLAQPRFYLVVIAIFACVAMLLSAVGIYSVLAYNVGQRTQEIGVRLALGAERGNILRLVIRQGMTPALLGVAAGILASLGLTRYLKSTLFEVVPTDLTTFVAVTLVLAVVALLACLIPARRATKVDPMTALRYE